MRPEETWKEFQRALDVRLLDLHTAPDGERWLSRAEYDQWIETHRLSHVRQVVVIRDMVARVYNDVVHVPDQILYAEYCAALGLEPPSNE